MKLDDKIRLRFTKLIEAGESVLATRRDTGGDWGYLTVDTSLAQEWGIKCLSTLERVFQTTSLHYVEFKNQFDGFHSVEAFSDVVKALAIMKAAKEDYEEGWLLDTRTLIEAEVFNDFLEQAEELLKNGYYHPAAVVAGCILEDGLRKLCDRNSVTISPKATIDPMNVELAKAGIYSKFEQKKITAWADLRNKAAHGEWNDFPEKGVEDMIRDVRRFMEEYFV